MHDIPRAHAHAHEKWSKNKWNIGHFIIHLTGFLPSVVHCMSLDNITRRLESKQTKIGGLRQKSVYNRLGYPVHLHSLVVGCANPQKVDQF